MKGPRFVIFRGRRAALPNPAECPRARKPVATITDRAKRYRANQSACKPPGPRRCSYCGSGRNVVVHHIDDNEGNGRRSNLAWACKSCNAALSAAAARAGRGVRTRQFNPRMKRGAAGLAQYAWAVSRICRRADQARGLCSFSRDPEVLDAVRIIRETPPGQRRRFAAMAAAARGRGRSILDEVPF